MPDGSALRLTTARYYTPTGRCIQKSYKNGNDNYFEEEYKRYENGELLSADSIKFYDSLKFKTPSGKIVYGGGGIMPDYFIPLDTSYRSSWLNKISFAGLISDFTLQYVENNRSILNNFKNTEQFINNYNVDINLINQLVNYCEKNKINSDEKAIKKSAEYLKLQMKALIGRLLFGNEFYYIISQKNDKVILKAISTLK